MGLTEAERRQAEHWIRHACAQKGDWLAGNPPHPE
jgi:hypothetical protein